MTAVAGEVADGLFVHPLNSPDFIRGTTLPALREGAARCGRTLDGFTIACQALLVTGFTEEEYHQAEASTRMQLAFYGSTPQYRVVLDAHGWGDLQPELNVLSKQGRWVEMAGLIDDRMLDAFTVRCEPKDVAARLLGRYGGLVNRLSVICHARPHRTHAERWASVVAEVHRASGTRAPS
jgi:probable F420-dependent oxidoreductase